MFLAVCKGDDEVMSSQIASQSICEREQDELQNTSIENFNESILEVVKLF